MMSGNTSVVGLSWQPNLTLFRSTIKEKCTPTEISALYKPNSQLVDSLFVPPNDPRKYNKLIKKQVKDTAGKNWFDMPAQTLTPELKKDLQLLKSMGSSILGRAIVIVGGSLGESGATVVGLMPNVDTAEKLVYSIGCFTPAEEPDSLVEGIGAKGLGTTGQVQLHEQAVKPLLKAFDGRDQLRSAIDPKRHYKKGDSKSKTLPKYFQVGTVIESPFEYFNGRLTKKERKATLADELLSDGTFRDYRKRKVREIEEVNRPAGVGKWKNSKSRKHGKEGKSYGKKRRH
ncbi:hypothetical protein OROGR_007402 [Orobanche gracilis]